MNSSSTSQTSPPSSLDQNEMSSAYPDGCSRISKMTAHPRQGSRCNTARSYACAVPEPLKALGPRGTVERTSRQASHHRMAGLQSELHRGRAPAPSIFCEKPSPAQNQICKEGRSRRVSSTSSRTLSLRFFRSLSCVNRRNASTRRGSKSRPRHRRISLTPSP